MLINDRCLRGPRTGVGHYVAQLLTLLPDAGVEIKPISPCRRWLDAHSVPSSSRPTSGSGKTDARIRAAGTKRYPWWIRRVALGSYNLTLRGLGNLRRCHLYHEPNHIPAPWAGPVVTTIHDLSVLRYPQWHPADRVRWYEQDFIAALDRSQHFITVSSFTRQEMIELLDVPADRITPIPLGVRPVFRPMGPEACESARRRHGWPCRYILYVGTLEPRKNLARVVEAYAHLDPGLRRNFPLLIGGVPGWGRDDLDALIRSHGITDHTRRLGYVGEEELAELYAGAHLFVWPSLYEGFGLPPLEAMACGTPVITSRCASLPEVVGDAAMLVEPQDTTALTESMRQVLEDDAVHMALRERGIARSQLFTWPRCVREHANVYRRLVDV